MAKDFHSATVVAGYDSHIRKLIPGYELVHQHINAILSSHLPETAQVLVVGCGTGYELQYLLQQHPQWQFTAIDPSLSMLQQAEKNIQSVAGHERVRFIQADTHQFAQQAQVENLQFDAALAILVAHFVPVAEKTLFFQDIYQTLKPTAILLSYDLMQQTENIELRWMQNLALESGLTVLQAEKMIARLADDFHLISAEAQQSLLTQVGFRQSKTYCQIMNYYGFFAQK